MYLLVEIILELTDQEKLGNLFSKVVTFRPDYVMDSHFYDDKNDCDVEYGEIDDFCSFALANRSTSSLFLNSVDCGFEMRKVVILISHDAHSVEVSLTVEKCDFSPSLDESIALIRHLLFSISSGIVDNVIIGYDPAKDDDMEIITLSKGKEYDAYKVAEKLYTELNSFT